MHPMIQKATATPEKPRGRPPAFDSEAVVACAVPIFWRCGYKGASLTELEQELGVNRSTLYNSFDGKEGLYRAAVEAYLNDVGSLLFEPLEQGTRGLDDLVAFTDRHRLSLTDPAIPPGCLLVNAMVTGDAPQAVEQYLRSFRDAIETALERAAALGELSPSTPSGLASVFLTATLGINLAAKSGMAVDQLHELFNGLRDLVEGWAPGREQPVSAQ